MLTICFAFGIMFDAPQNYSKNFRWEHFAWMFCIDEQLKNIFADTDETPLLVQTFHWLYADFKWEASINDSGVRFLWKVTCTGDSDQIDRSSSLSVENWNAFCSCGNSNELCELWVHRGGPSGKLFINAEKQSELEFTNKDGKREQTNLELFACKHVTSLIYWRGKKKTIWSLLKKIFERKYSFEIYLRCGKFCIYNDAIY